MPKLSQEALDEKRGRLEEAAKELFIKHGFHATSMRDIARGADASLGSLYNHYRTKEDILESIIARYKLFGGNSHLGMSDDRVIKTLTHIFCRGVMRPEKRAGR